MTKPTEPAALNLTPRASSLRSTTTFCIKTIHRPQCCAALVRSIHEHYGTHRPTIHVLDDGKPELRFSSNYPAEEAMVEQIIETEYDIGLSAGRNRLLDAGDTPFAVFADDDHLVTPQTRLPELVDKLNRHNDIDLLAAISNQQERHPLLQIRIVILEAALRKGSRSCFSEDLSFRKTAILRSSPPTASLTHRGDRTVKISTSTSTGDCSICLAPFRKISSSALHYSSELH